MKVLMQIRSNVFEVPGGDTIQMQKTKEALETLGCEVDLSLELRPDLSRYDLVHLFNLTRVQETFIQVKNAVAQNKPIVFSTIYWPNIEFEKNANIGIRGILGKKYLMTHAYQKMQRYILGHTKIFLPNAQQEMKQIEKVLGFKAENESIVVVPNAIDVEVAKSALRSDCHNYDQYKGWLICVGRIDTRKNQLKLIESIAGSDYKLLLIGKQSPGQKNYYKKVMNAIQDNPNIQYIESVENSKLYQIYKVCKVSVLPSWFETPGLVSLEAAAMGCNIVVSNKGTTKDYFKEFAYYCDVMDSASIRKQIDKAYNVAFDPRFRDMIFNEYTWDKAGEATFDGYRMALNED